MIRQISLFTGLFLIILLFVTQSPAQTSGLRTGFYTRGAEPAGEIDQLGGATGERFYLPVAENSSFHPRITVAAVYEDNAFLSSRDSQDGYTITVAPGVMWIWGRPGQNHIYVDYGYSYPLADNLDTDRQAGHLFTLGTRHDTGKTRSDIEAGYRRIEEVDTVTADRISQRNYSLGVDLEHRMSVKTSAGLLGEVLYSEYDNSSRYIDYNRVYGAVRGFHAAGARSDVFLQAGIGRDQQRENPAFKALNQDLSSVFYDLSLGMRGQVSPKSSVSGRVGYQWREDLGDGDGSFAHWIASASAETRPFGFTTFGVDLSADIRPSIDVPGAQTIDQRLTGRVERRLLTESVRGNASVFAGLVQYEVSEGEPFSETIVYRDREDDYWGYSVGVDWWLKQNLSFGLSYSYIENNSDLDENRVVQDPRSYEAGRWTGRASWNY